MALEKGLLVAAVVVFAGVIGYKVVKKKNPSLIKKSKNYLSGWGKRASRVISEARQSFQEGYQQA